MESIKLESHVGSDGMLKLEVPVGFKDADLEVTVMVQPTPRSKLPEARGWPPDFFEETFGCFSDDPLVIDPVGKPEEREPLL